MPKKSEVFTHTRIEPSAHGRARVFVLDVTEIELDAQGYCYPDFPFIGCSVTRPDSSGCFYNNPRCREYGVGGG